jgi:hypothetical protein
MARKMCLFLMVPMFMFYFSCAWHNGVCKKQGQRPLHLKLGEPFVTLMVYGKHYIIITEQCQELEILRAG